MEDQNHFDLQREQHIKNYLASLKQKQNLDQVRSKFHEPCEFDEIDNSFRFLDLEHPNQQSYLQLHKQSEDYVKRPNFFKIQKIIKKAISSFLSDVFIRRISKLTNRRLFFINDATVITDEEQPEREEQSHINLNFFQQFLNLIPAFQPNSSFLVCWNLLNACLKLSLVFLYSFHQFFYLNLIDCNHKNYTSIYLIVVLLLIFDVFINLNKIQIKHGVYIVEKQHIAMNYLKKGFRNDVLGIVPLFATLIRQCTEEDHIKFDLIFFINFLIYFMIFNFYSTVAELEKLLKPTPTRKMIIKLCRLGFFLILLAHLTGCGLKFVGDFGLQRLNYETNWLNSKDLQDSQWYIQYMYSFYWACTTMITVGYGDFVPKTPLETIFITCVMFLGCGVFGFIINQVGSIFSELNQRSLDFENEYEVLTQLLHQKRMPKDLIQRSLAYLEYIHKFNNKTRKALQKDILLKLSPLLRQEIFHQQNQQVLAKFSILVNQFSKQSLERVMLKIEEQITTPGEIIYYSDSVNDQYLYLLDNGSVEFISEPFSSNQEMENNNLKRNSQKIKFVKVKQVREPQIFGQLGFFTGESNQLTARSLNFCTLYKIKRQDFIDIIRYNPTDLEKFMEIQDDVRFNMNYERIDLQCVACQEYSNHIISNCPYIHFTLNCSKLAVKLMNQVQNRLQIFRDENIIIKKQYNSLHQMRWLNQQIKTLYESAQQNGSEFMTDSQFQPTIKSGGSVNPAILDQQQDQLSSLTDGVANGGGQQLSPCQTDDDMGYFNSAKRIEMKREKSKHPSMKKQNDIEKMKLKDPTHRTEKRKYSSQNETLNQQDFSIDRIQEFTSYFPQGNTSQQIKAYSKLQRKNKIKKKQKEIQKKSSLFLLNVQSEVISHNPHQVRKNSKSAQPFISHHKLHNQKE